MMKKLRMNSKWQYQNGFWQYGCDGEKMTIEEAYEMDKTIFIPTDK
tara:strand:- start:276 stop:413 length:138 start_codon:yes stop_codon:yes gene_type:complete